MYRIYVLHCNIATEMLENFHWKLLADKKRIMTARSMGKLMKKEI